MSWFTRLFPIVRVIELEALNSILKEENATLRTRLREFEIDERETRRGLLTRSGILAPELKTGNGSPELKPIRKATVPWHVQAAKLETDSRERHWKKVIEEAEKSPGQRQSEANARATPLAPTPEKTEAEQIDEDIEEMSR